METETETGEVSEPDTTEGEDGSRGVAEVLEIGEKMEVVTKARRNEKSPKTTLRTKTKLDLFLKDAKNLLLYPPPRATFYAH